MARHVNDSVIDTMDVVVIHAINYSFSRQPPMVI